MGSLIGPMGHPAGAREAMMAAATALTFSGGGGGGVGRHYLPLAGWLPKERGRSGGHWVIMDIWGRRKNRLFKPQVAPFLLLLLVLLVVVVVVVKSVFCVETINSTQETTDESPGDTQKPIRVRRIGGRGLEGGG